MNIFVIVEDLSYEGFKIHGIFSDLDSAVKNASKLNSDGISKKYSHQIEELPTNTMFVSNGYENNTNLDNVLRSYSLDGELKFDFENKSTTTKSSKPKI